MSSSKDIEMQGRDAQRGASADDASPANAPGATPGATSTDDGARDLLLGLLYGELDHEDATRAERRVREDAALAHELEGWERIRSLVRELPQEEPPDALSVKLLHAAAEASKSRGADQEAHGGVWAWVKNLFAPIVMYPGLAAAASLVLVAGITGVVYLSGQSMKSMMSEPRVAAPAAAPAKATEAEMKQALPGSAVRPRDPAARDRVAADKAAADTADDAWDAEEQAALADTRAAEVAVQPEDRMPAEPMAGNVQGGLVGGTGTLGAAGPGGRDSEGMATGGGGVGSSGYDDAERSQRRARKSDSPAGALERKEELRKGRAAPTARLYEGGELDEARQNRAPQTATSRDRSNAGARPYAQPPPPPPPSNAGVGVSAGVSVGVAVGRGGGAAAPAQKQTKTQKTKKAPAPARPAPGAASAPRQEPAPASAPAADEDAPAAEPEPEAAEAPRDRAPASKPKASTEAPTEGSAGAPSKRARNDAGKDQGVQARVRDLHRKALAAAKKKDCDVVSNLARQVRELDASFYRSAFLGNKSLQACLGSGKNATKK